MIQQIGPLHYEMLENIFRMSRMLNQVLGHYFNKINFCPRVKALP